MKFLFDFFPILLFFVAYKTYDIFVATGVAIVASIIQVVWSRAQNGRFETMHLVTLGMIVVLGGATLLFQDRQFIMWKPTAINWLLAAILIGSHYVADGKTIAERLMSSSITLPKPIWARLNLGWAVFFIVVGVANIFVADRFFQSESAFTQITGVSMEEIKNAEACESQYGGSDALDICLEAVSHEADWVNFKLFGTLGMTFIFIILQGVYIARHMKDDEPVEDSTGANE